MPPALAVEPFIYPARELERGRLVIHAATDRSAMEPLVLDFQAIRPEVAVDYLDLSTNELFARVTNPPDGLVPDLVISSAMDLQAKLVNDGWSRPHRSAATARVPPWANWRDEAFGFTYEPAVIVHHRARLSEAEAPRDRAGLLRLLQRYPERFRGRIATYDPAASGVGYLFATQDSVLSSQFWQLAAVLGRLQARLVATSADALTAIEEGEIDLAYNVLGSYARLREAAGAPIGIIAPDDYTLVMSRVVTIPRQATNPVLAGSFVDYLLSERGQSVVELASRLQAITTRLPRAEAGSDEATGATDADHPIRLGPALLVFLDGVKRARFLADWHAMMNVLDAQP